MEDYRNFKNSPDSNIADNKSSSNGLLDIEQEIQQTKCQIREVKQDSVAATRHAVSKLAESEAIASKTLNQLEKQSDKIKSIDRQMELADLRADQTVEKSKELKHVNKSMFSAFSFRNIFKRKKDPTKLNNLKREIELEKENNNGVVETLPNELNTESFQSKTIETNSHSVKVNLNKPANSQYTFEGDEEDSKLEKEIDENLEDISSALGRLKDMSLSMSTQIEEQNEQLDRINKNTTNVHDKVETGKEILKTIK